MQIEEGRAVIFKDECTFFNPAQRLNRDLSVEVIRECFAARDSIRVLDAMSATGLRGIRYLGEIPNAAVYLNDISETALQTIRTNLVLNGVENVAEYSESGLMDIRTGGGRASLIRSDCNALMASLTSFFDVIDIDPFGSCSEYIDNALRSIRHGGLLCFTATDKAVLCSNERKCQTKYSTTILRKIGMNELPLRTILSLVSRQASKFGSSIEPVASLSVDFYVRVFIRVLKRHPKAVIASNSLIFMCRCYNIVEAGECMSSTCSNCQENMRLCGPFWNGHLHSRDVVQRILDRLPVDADNRLVGVLRYLRQEISTLFYYELPRLSSLLKTSTLKQTSVMNALANMGYDVSYTHCELNAVKTNASVAEINRVLRQDEGVDFRDNAQVSALGGIQFFRGLMKSGLGPLSLPKTPDAEYGRDMQ